MEKLLYIESSPRKTRSRSIQAAEAFLEAYREANPDGQILKIDLWDKAIPEFDGHTIEAKYQVLHGQEFDSEQQVAWQAVVDLCDEFKSADKYLFSLPMWNFGIPYKLKHYIDVITQPGQTFSFSPETGYSGLVTDRPAVAIYARGGSYVSEQTSAMDFQRTYLKLWLGFIGFTEIDEILYESTLGAPEDVAQAKAVALSKARELGSRF
tara:strand:+ start:1142 stop:1768 length:627 start_codon:yes stop_codon:yes gene_type:complete